MKIGIVRWMQYLLICAGLAACAVPPPAAALVIPNTGDPAQSANVELAAVEPTSAVFRVIEYPLVEQSIDNPNHPGFAARAAEAVATRRAGFGLFRAQDALEEPNLALEPFGYRIAPSNTPPFSSYALYQNGRLVIGDISRFWSLDEQEDDFLLLVETLSGDRIAASNGSIQVIATAEEAPNDGRLAYAGSGDAALFTGRTQAAQTFEGAIYQQVIDGKTLALYQRDSVARLSYAGEELPFVYDAVLYGGGPESAMYQPGSMGQVVWFYALRDGLWYYVEAGLME